MIVLPAMSRAQAASWHGVMDLYERLDHGWTLIGGQMVHLHCAEHNLPDGVGERAASRIGATGGPTIPTPGGTQALQRTECVPVNVEGRGGFVLRPNVVGALVMKAAAHTTAGDAFKRRHRRDFATLAALIAAQDFRDAELSRKDRRRLRDMIGATRADSSIMSEMDDAAESLNRLERAAGIGT